MVYYYHFSKRIKQIKQHGFIVGKSLARTDTFDVLVELFPKLLFRYCSIQGLSRSLPLKRKTYKSNYSNHRLRFKNALLGEFFTHNRYILAFDSCVPKGWIRSGLFQLLSRKIGRSYLRFRITPEMAKHSFVLEQKYWSPHYSQKHFGLNVWDPKFDVTRYPKIAKEIFGKYYLSIKRLCNYQSGEFEVPEFWIAGKVPFSACKHGSIPLEVFSRHLRQSKMIRQIKILDKH